MDSCLLLFLLAFAERPGLLLLQNESINFKTTRIHRVNEYKNDLPDRVVKYFTFYGRRK